MNILDLLKLSQPAEATPLNDRLNMKLTANADMPLSNIPNAALNNQVPFDPAIKAYPDNPQLQAQSDFLSQFKNLGMQDNSGNLNMQLTPPVEAPNILPPLELPNKLATSPSEALAPLKKAIPALKDEAAEPSMGSEAYMKKMLREGQQPSEPPQVPELKQATEKQQPVEQPKKEEDYLELLKQAQGESKDKLKDIAMMEAIDKIGQSFARQGRTAVDTSGWDTFRKLAQQQVTDIEKQQQLAHQQKAEQREQERLGMEKTRLGMDQQKFEKDMKMADINLDKVALQIGDEKAKRDPNSDYSQMARESNAKELEKLGMKDLANNIRKGNLSAQQIEDLYGQYKLTDLMRTWENAQTRAMEYKLRTEEKHRAENTKRLDNANKLITASISRNNTAFGKSANILRSAEAIETMVKDMNPKDIDNRQITEIARNLDAMLSSGAATISGMQKLIPRTLSGDKAKILEYISSIPKGAGQEAFVRKMMETVTREKNLAAQQIQKESGKLLSSYADLQKQMPEEWDLMMRQHELDPNLFKNLQEPSASPKAPAAQKQLTPAQEAGLANFMKVNKITDRNQAIKILKDNGKL